MAISKQNDLSADVQVFLCFGQVRICLLIQIRVYSYFDSLAGFVVSRQVVSRLFGTARTAACQVSLSLHHLLELAQVHVHGIGKLPPA